MVCFMAGPNILSSSSAPVNAVGSFPREVEHIAAMSHKLNTSVLRLALLSDLSSHLSQVCMQAQGH